MKMIEATLAWCIFAALPYQRVAEASQLRLKQPLPPFMDPLEDCLEVPQSICLNSDDGKSFVVTRPAVTPDLVAWYRFDKSLPIDDSGHREHLLDQQYQLTQFPVGPGIMGKGGSISFDGHGYRVAKHTEAWESSCFTAALWLYLLEDSVGGWRTIFSKGSNPGELMPGLMLRPDERRLHARVSPQAESSDGSLDSVGLIPLRRWTHIAVTSTGSVLRLFVNGLQDGEVIIEGADPSSGDLHIGRDPWRAGIKGYVDDFRWYNRGLSPGEIQAMLFPSLTGIGTDFVHLGCSSCSFTDAVRSCKDRSHLCSLQELFAGGFHTARVMGWLANSPEVWYHNEQSNDLFTGMRKLGLCCLGPTE